MSETLYVPEGATKKEIYDALLPQIAAVVDGCDDLIANQANVSAILKTALNFYWVGFYRTTAPETLTLGPFQGPLACVTINFQRGVCGKAARDRATVMVPDVNKFPGHIACSGLSQSEIVVPFAHQGQTQFLLDVDSDKLEDFDTVDQHYLEKIVSLIGKKHFS